LLLALGINIKINQPHTRAFRPDTYMDTVRHFYRKVCVDNPSNVIENENDDESTSLIYDE